MMEEQQACWRRKDVEAFEFVLADARGRWFLARLLEVTGALKPEYLDASSGEALLLGEGRRRAGIDCRRLVEGLPEGMYVLRQMEQEHEDFVQYVKAMGGYMDGDHDV